MTDKLCANIVSLSIFPTIQSSDPDDDDDDDEDVKIKSSSSQAFDETLENIRYRNNIMISDGGAGTSGIS